jgi:uncharacterized membrane protein
MNRYEIFKFLHIVGAIAWLGSGIALTVLARQMRKEKDYAGLLVIGHHSQALGMLLFTPAALLTVGFGIALVATDPTIRFGDLWILIGFGGILGSGVAQMALAAPAERRFLSAAAEYGTDHPETSQAARRLSLGSILDNGVLIFVVWAMVAKPMW